MNSKNRLYRCGEVSTKNVYTLSIRVQSFKVNATLIGDVTELCPATNQAGLFNAGSPVNHM